VHYLHLLNDRRLTRLTGSCNNIPNIIDIIKVSNSKAVIINANEIIS